MWFFCQNMAVSLFPHVAEEELQGTILPQFERQASKMKKNVWLASLGLCQQSKVLFLLLALSWPIKIRAWHLTWYCPAMGFQQSLGGTLMLLFILYNSQFIQISITSFHNEHCKPRKVRRHIQTKNMVSAQLVPEKQNTPSSCSTAEVRGVYIN